MQNTSQDSAKAEAAGVPTPADHQHGLELKSARPLLAETVELISSMRFAISALAVVCIASAIGTIVPQNSPPINYVNQFGAFWAEAFTVFDLFHVYNAPWFLLVMVLMLVSTSLCLVRNTPRMIREALAWRDQVRAGAFAAFHHRVAVDLPAGQSANDWLTSFEGWLGQKGYKVRRASSDPERPALVAKKGASNRLGYIATHLAIVVIALGGLLDSEVPTRLAIWWWDKAPLALGAVTDETQIPASARLPAQTPTYRANLLIPEGQTSDMAVLNRPEGALLLDLPFELELKAFRVEYYATGMPKLFASDVILKDKATGETRETTIEVNKPLIHEGVAIYQSSFDDGGSRLKLLAHPLTGAGRKPLPIDLAVGQSVPLRGGDTVLNLEIAAFKAINVENLTGRGITDDAFKDHVASVLSPAANESRQKELTNVGPAVQYKLRDAAGQAKEFHTYMLPFELDGAEVFLAGVRTSPDQPFQYLRIPADQDDSLNEFLRIRAAMENPQFRKLAAKRFAERSAPAALQPSLSESAERALGSLAEGGLNGLAEVLERSVPENERDRAAEVVVRMVTGAFWELWQEARQADGLAAMEFNDANQQFAQRALQAFSDSRLFDAPLLVAMTDFEEVKASVFQVTRSPGQPIVYLGCLLLTLGVFAMFYVREQRLWVWVKPRSEGGSHLMVAASSPRQSLDFDREFESLSKAIQASKGVS